MTTRAAQAQTAAQQAAGMAKQTGDAAQKALQDATAAAKQSSDALAAAEWKIQTTIDHDREEAQTEETLIGSAPFDMLQPTSGTDGEGDPSFFNPSSANDLNNLMGIVTFGGVGGSYAGAPGSGNAGNSSMGSSNAGSVGNSSATTLGEVNVTANIASQDHYSLQDFLFQDLFGGRTGAFGSGMYDVQKMLNSMADQLTPLLQSAKDAANAATPDLSQYNALEAQSQQYNNDYNTFQGQYTQDSNAASDLQSQADQATQDAKASQGAYQQANTLAGEAQGQITGLNTQLSQESDALPSIAPDVYSATPDVSIQPASLAGVSVASLNDASVFTASGDTVASTMGEGADTSLEWHNPAYGSGTTADAANAKTLDQVTVTQNDQPNQTYTNDGASVEDGGYSTMYALQQNELFKAGMAAEQQNNEDRAQWQANRAKSWETYTQQQQQWNQIDAMQQKDGRDFALFLGGTAVAGAVAPVAELGIAYLATISPTAASVTTGGLIGTSVTSGGINLYQGIESGNTYQAVMGGVTLAGGVLGVVGAARGLMADGAIAAGSDGTLVSQRYGDAFGGGTGGVPSNEVSVVQSAGDGATPSSAAVFQNQLPENLDEELAISKSLGVQPMGVDDPGFDDLVNQGTIKYVVTESGDVVVGPYSVDGTEISHAVLSGGDPVLAAGEAEIAGNSEDGYIGISLNPNSGHFMAGNTPAQNAAVMQVANNSFRYYGINF